MIKENKTIFLSAILILILLGGGYWFLNRQASAEEVAQKAMDYLNGNLLPANMSASLNGVTEKENIVELKFDIEDREYTSYVTKDGELFFIEGINLNEEIPVQNNQEQQQVEIPKSDKPEVELFVMSYCPYGLQAQKAFLPVYDLLKEEADLGVYFVDYIMHDKKEIDENLRQYCIQKDQEEKFSSYLSCFVDKGSYQDENSSICLAEANIDEVAMNSCIDQADQEYNIYGQYEDKSTWKQGNYPRFDLQSDLNKEYGVQGSPALVINGTLVSSFDRTPEGLKSLVCNSFNEAPEDCSETLSSQSFEAGFGLGEGDSSDASCQ